MASSYQIHKTLYQYFIRLVIVNPVCLGEVVNLSPSHLPLERFSAYA